MTMQSTQRLVFHQLLRRCLSEQADPTEAELHFVAEKIWNESFAARTGYLWPDVPANAEQFAMKAARLALGCS